MFKKNVYVAMFAMSTYVGLQADISSIETAYDTVFNTESIQHSGSLIIGIDPDDVVMWNNTQRTIDSNIQFSAKGDKDILEPWNVIKQQNNIIISTIVEWHALVIKASEQNKNLDGSVVRQSVYVLENAWKSLNTAYDKINKAWFVNTNKREIVRSIKRFAELLNKVCLKAISELKSSQSELLYLNKKFREQTYGR